MGEKPESSHLPSSVSPRHSTVGLLRSQKPQSGKREIIRFLPRGRQIRSHPSTHQRRSGVDGFLRECCRRQLEANSPSMGHQNQPVFEPAALWRCGM